MTDLLRFTANVRKPHRNCSTLCNLCAKIACCSSDILRIPPSLHMIQKSVFVRHSFQWYVQSTADRVGEYLNEERNKIKHSTVSACPSDKAVLRWRWVWSIGGRLLTGKVRAQRVPTSLFTANISWIGPVPNPSFHGETLPETQHGVLKTQIVLHNV
jgi:hypothetical protein